MLDSPDAPNCPASPDAAAHRDEGEGLRAECGRLAAAIADRDRTIAELSGRLEEARLTLLWQRTEIAARDRKIADLWSQADGLNQALVALNAGRDARPTASAGPVPPASSRPQRSLLGLLSRRRDDPVVPGMTAAEHPQKVA